jgi:hypothetical protein
MATELHHREGRTEQTASLPVVLGFCHVTLLHVAQMSQEYKF